MFKELCWGAILAAVSLVGSGCGGSKIPVVVGSKSATSQVVLGEIVAQHLERRLGRPVIRRLNIGTTQLLYQSITNNEIGLYPEDTGAAQTGILKEAISTDAGTTLERVRNEMRRLAQIEVLNPLGIENNWAFVISKDDAAKDKLETLTDAARVKPGWKLGVTRDFSERIDGLAAFSQYRLPMIAMTRVSDAAPLYDALAAKELTMVAGNVTDGTLTAHDGWKILQDDRKVFPSYQTCLFVRSDVIASDPKIQPALAELAGKFSNNQLRKLNAEVDVNHKKPADVAAEFLAQAGLK